MTETQGSSAKGGAEETVLDRIVAAKRGEIRRLRPRGAELEQAARQAPPPRDFEGALRREGRVAVLAEVKRRSPGAGPIRPDLDAASLGRDYARGGAAALSVLTDGEHFGGSLEDLERAREASGLPVLRKDFVLDPVQVHEARAAGADAVLLIVRILEPGTLAELLREVHALGMAALVEAHDAGEVRTALEAGARIVGVNNRDLARFETTLDVTLRLALKVPEEVVLVSESGIRDADDVDRLGAAGVDAVLVGEGLLRTKEPGEAARELTDRPRTGDRAAP